MGVYDRGCALGCPRSVQDVYRHRFLVSPDVQIARIFTDGFVDFCLLGYVAVISRSLCEGRLGNISRGTSSDSIPLVKKSFFKSLPAPSSGILPLLEFWQSPQRQRANNRLDYRTR